VPAIIILSPLLAVIALAVRLTSPGPVIFRQQRAGRHKEPFECWKFRTMRHDCDDEIHRAYVSAQIQGSLEHGGEPGVFKLTGDPRVTRVGAFLRRTSLDELPQLFNVVAGDMSLVGPRPSLPWEVELFDAEFEPRFDVPPGITGLWQVSGRSEVTFREALALDVEYVQRRSLALDVSILLRTPHAALSSGAR